VKKLFQRNELVRGQFMLGARAIDLSRIDCPLLLLTARNDHLVPPASTNGIRARVGSDDVTALMADGGHVGLVVGGKAQKTIWREATTWAADRSTALERPSAAQTPVDSSNGAQLENGHHGS